MNVYLAKSNAANINLVIQIRNKLINYGHTVVEHTGGTYTDKKMLGCDVLVMIPPADFLVEEDFVFVGMGLFNQAKAWLNADKPMYKLDHNSYLSSFWQVSYEGADIYNVLNTHPDTCDQEESSASRNYGALRVSNNPCEFDKIFGEMFVGRETANRTVDLTTDQHDRRKLLLLE